jgi:hypothetical protein
MPALLTDDRKNSQPARDFADCLALDQRRLRALARDLRHLFGSKRDALQAESDACSTVRARPSRRAARACRNRSLPTICRSTCAATRLRR